MKIIQHIENLGRLDRIAFSLAVGAVFAAGLGEPAQAQPGPPRDETYALARDAYLYAYPIVSMDVTMRQATNVKDATTVNMRAPINQFAHVRSYPHADEKDVVRFNFDTLYSFAWLDVSAEPVVVSVPDTRGRYYLLPMLDMWTDVFAVVGSRTTGTRAGDYAVVGPDWRGELPAGMGKIVAPTSTIWILGRTQTNGPSDYDAVHAVQDGYQLAPLSQWGKKRDLPPAGTLDPTVDDTTPPQVQVNAMDGVAMLTRLAELMKTYPPHPNDYPLIFRLKRIGIEPGKSFDASKLDPEAVAVVNRAAADALADLPVAMRKAGAFVNGWNIGTENMGTYGTSYKRRAFVALGGLGCNLPEDAVYPTAFVDGQGTPLTGAKKYVLHFEKGKTPPADAFWSLTMYDKAGFQVPNPINRFALGSHDNLAFNADGSLDLYIQADSPGKDKESNWLPAPRGNFEPSLRLYSPRPEVLDLEWTPPPFNVVD